MTHDRHSKFDAHMMDIALAMARQGQGNTWPNPSVGAVIADENTTEIIARGVTMTGGRPHAETVAIETAGSRARDKTMYVTLEPCSHIGQTPPCANAIIDAGISRVVIAQPDPDPRVAGRGLKALKRAGVSITTGLRQIKAREMTLGHILRVTERRPFIQLKLALGKDGDVPRGTNAQPSWVTGPIARAHGHMLRATSDAILIGSGTLIDDDPELTCRLPGLKARSPIRVVVCSPKQIDAGTKLLKSAPQVPVWVATGSHGHKDAGAQLGYQVIEVPMVGDKVWLPALAEALVERGITRLLVEGGPTLWRAFANAGLVDEVVAFIAGGSNQTDSVSQNNNRNVRQDQAIKFVQHLLPGIDLNPYDTRCFGDDTMYKFKTK